MITLYGYWRSTAAYRVRIALNYKQVAYNQKSIHLVKDGGQQNHPDYQKINPQKLVPTLIDGDFSISQSIAILEYIEEKYAELPLMPTDVKQKALVRQLCQLIACDIHPLNNLRVLQYLKKDLAVSDEDKARWYHHWIREGFKAYDSLISDKEVNLYSVGEELSMADLCLIPQIYNANRFNFPMDEFPRLQQINQNCMKLRAFRDAAPENQADAI
jgi:maleylacetoacetate isomerase